VALFNRGEFFECHEVLEELWLESGGAEKQFLQGLIQVAVAFYHLRQGNFVGSRRLLEAGVKKLAAGSAPHPQVDVAALLTQIRELPHRLEKGDIPPDWPAPEIRFVPPS
jgi:predicted metal-dependent hydrolase